MPITIDQLDELHARVALDILENDNNQPVYEGVAPDEPATPYVLVYTQVTWPDKGDGTNFDMVTNQCVTNWITYSVGSTETSARAVANRVRQLLVNVQPTITGRSCGRIQQTGASSPDRDERIGRLVYTLEATYTLYTNG